MNERLDAALQYAGRGWPVLPIHSIRKGKCSCHKGVVCDQGPGKHPRTKHGLLDASIDRAIIESWWRQWPDANVAVRTGQASGLFVLDVDGDEGRATLKALIDQFGPLPGAPVVRTSRGLHIYFSVPPGSLVPNSSGQGLDIRGENGYVLAPPSVHASGHVYSWVTP